jgi:hypothetical protein
MNGPETLRAAAHVLSTRHEKERANALAGLLHNRARDMENNIAIWRCTGQDVAALIGKHYGVYLAVARAILSNHVYYPTDTVRPAAELTPPPAAATAARTSE